MFQAERTTLGRHTEMTVGEAPGEQLFASPAFVSLHSRKSPNLLFEAPSLHHLVGVKEVCCQGPSPSGLPIKSPLLPGDTDWFKMNPGRVQYE